MTNRPDLRRRFALDQNFPDPIVSALQRFQGVAELVPLRQIDTRLPDMDDWKMLLALHHHRTAWDGLITTDSSMLNQESELATLLQTKLTLVVANDAGHDPVKASGLVFAHLAGICKRVNRGTPQIWRLSATSRPATDPWEHLQRVAEHRSVPTDDLWRAARLPPHELSTNPLA